MFCPTLSRFIHVLPRLSGLSLHSTSQTPKQKFSLHSEAPFPARFTLYTRSSHSESVYILVCCQEDSCLDDFVGTSFFLWLECQIVFSHNVFIVCYIDIISFDVQSSRDVFAYYSSESKSCECPFLQFPTQVLFPCKCFFDQAWLDLSTQIPHRLFSSKWLVPNLAILHFFFFSFQHGRFDASNDIGVNDPVEDKGTYDMTIVQIHDESYFESRPYLLVECWWRHTLAHLFLEEEQRHLVKSLISISVISLFEVVVFEFSDNIDLHSSFCNTRNSDWGTRNKVMQDSSMTSIGGQLDATTKTFRFVSSFS